MKYFVYLKCKKQKTNITHTMTKIQYKDYNQTIFFFFLHALATSFPRIIPSAP